MKRHLFLAILLFFPLTVLATKQESKEQVFNERENFPLTSHYKVTPKVNIITGEYIEDECDLVVAGSEPLSFRRFYGHFSPYHPGYASWRVNPEHFCAANLEWAEQNCFVAVGAENGNVICYENRPQSGVYAFNLTGQSSFTNSDMTGQHHPLNTKINYRKTDATRGDFRWEGEIIEGDGSKKTFKTPLHSWLSKIRLFQYPRYNEGPYTVTPNVWTPYQLPIIEERKPNGNIICYEYVPLPTNKNYPGYHLVSSITAYNSNKTKVLGSLKFKYNTTGQGYAVMGIDVVGSDGRKSILKYNYADVLEGGEYLKYLSSVTSPNNPHLSYISDKTSKMKYKEGKRIKGVEKPEGRLFTTEYHKDSWKVTAQNAPVGPNGEMCPINRYTYSANATEVIDAEGNKKIYRYDANQRITSIETHQNRSLYCTQTFNYDPATGNLLSKKFHDFIEEFKYDKNQNVIEEKRGNGKESYTIYRTFSDDGFNLKLSERDDFGKLIRYNYVKGTNLLASEFVFEGNRIRKRAFYFYDDCAICTKAILDDGTSENPYDLANVTYRKIKIIKPRYDHPCFGLPEVTEERTINASGDEILLSKVAYTYAPSGKVTKEEHYDSTNSHRYTLRNEYDQNERLICSTDALSNKTTYTYDANNNLTSLAGPCGLKKEWSYDKADRPTKVTDNHNLTITKKYDKLGRVISETDECGATTQFQYDALGRLTTTTFADGRSTKKEYDIYNNVIKETDAKGFEINKTYNFRGQVTSIKYPDGCEEHFTYRPDGQLISSIDRNGAKKVYTYDIFDHVICEETLSTKGELLKKTTASYSPFVLLSTTDGEGVLTKYTYDFAGKKLKSNTASKLITYSYDTLGRLFKTQIGDTLYIEELDLLNQLVEKRTETINKQVLEKENYEYDALGNKTHVITSKGTTKTTFNTRGDIVSIKDPLGHTTEFLYSYGKGGFTKTVINPKKIEKTHIYNGAKKEIETSTKNGSNESLQKTLRTFDKNGNLIESKEFVYEGTLLTKIITHNWTYDAGNRVTSLLEAGQKKTTYQYDTHGRLKTLIKPNGVALHHTYDDLGRLTRYYGADFDYHYQYDRCDRVVAVVDTISNTTTTRSYDNFGNVIQEKLANGLKLANTFDDSGRRILLTLPDGSTASYSYNGNQIYSITRKNLTHTYTQTDLEGNVTEIDLPANLGKIDIEYDSVDRIKKFSSSYYKATFPKDAYDATGNLCCYNFTDPLGTVKESFTYDPLDQLISENDHSYAFDSINNRTQKDETKHPINLLCQIDNIPYDANGNLLECENCKLNYDTQDRLISVKKEGMTVSYTYDPFGRRLSKTFRNEKGSTITQFFLYDGDNEIGSTNDQGTIEELRILGSGLGAEIGAAVFIELKNKTYIPIHDFRGNIATLIDPTTQKATETYRFTAFGEDSQQPKPTPLLSPWRFASKRHDPETHLINFGKRYYNTTLGRWLTPDPQGFTAGPNLYAYVTNNPLTHFDLYGLIDTHRGRGILNDLFYAFSRKNFHFSENSSRHSPHCRHYYPNYEAKFPNKSKMLDLGLSSNANRGFGFANGIKNSESDARKAALMLSSMAGDVNIDINYSATNSLSKDLYTAASNIFGGTMTPDAINLLSTWTKFFTTNPNGYYQQFCHSRGTAQVRNALRHAPGHIRERIYVVAVAPSAYIPKHFAGRVAHVVSRRDLVPWIDIRGRLASKETTTVLSPHAEAGLFDHGIDSPTYQLSIQRNIFEFHKWADSQ